MRTGPAGRADLDNYGTHKAPAIKKWLLRRRSPVSISWWQAACAPA